MNFQPESRLVTTRGSVGGTNARSQRPSSASMKAESPSARLAYLRCIIPVPVPAKSPAPAGEYTLTGIVTHEKQGPEVRGELCCEKMDKQNCRGEDVFVSKRLIMLLSMHSRRLLISLREGLLRLVYAPVVRH